MPLWEELLLSVSNSCKHRHRCIRVVKWSEFFLTSKLLIPRLPSAHILVKSKTIKNIWKCNQKIETKKKNQFRNGTLGVCKTFTINLLIIFLLNFWCFSIMVFDSTQCWMDGRPDNGYFRIPHNFSDLLTPLRHLDLNL